MREIIGICFMFSNICTVIDSNAFLNLSIKYQSGLNYVPTSIFITNYAI